METNKLRRIIQGGMGVNISSWPLARVVSILGQQGTVSGVELERVMTHVLQLGDPGGYIRRALSHFPFPNISEKIIQKFFVEGGLKNNQRIKPVQMLNVKPSALLISLIICANFAYVWLAKEGHDNPISINYLEKISIPHVYAITGSMMAGVDYITMGAGLPLQIPDVIKGLSEGREVGYRIPVIGRDGKNSSYNLTFNPTEFFGKKVEFDKTPGFIPIISSNILGELLAKKLAHNSITGLVLEGPSAGGHNAPIRELTYSKIKDLGWPFWIGGSCASADSLKQALEVGAVGIQAGSIFALSNESSMAPNIKQKIRDLGFEGKIVVRTDTRISPTGFPFKVLSLDGSISEAEIYNSRARICNQGALVSVYETANGKFGYRCSAEPVDIYVAKGGNVNDTVGRGCLCNGLNSTAGLVINNEPPIVTLGDDFSFLQSPMLMKKIGDGYSAEQAIQYILS